MTKGSICRNCFHSYVCEQFNENKDDNNEKCHFLNDHYVPIADVVPKSEVDKLHEVIFMKEDLMQSIAKERNYYYDELQKTKSEVEKIFEEIDELIDTYSDEYGTMLTLEEDEYSELKKKHLVTDTNVGGKYKESEGKG